MRLFIAVEIDKKNRKLIHTVQEKYRNNSFKGSFTRPDNYHITLKFLGDTDYNLIDKIRFSMERAAEHTGVFSFVPSDPGFFSAREGLILWIGIEKGSEELWKLNNAIEEEFFKAGFAKENRIYTPHITIGRSVRLKQDFRELSGGIIIPDIEVYAENITLMESVREKGLMCYYPVFRVSLDKRLP